MNKIRILLVGILGLISISISTYGQTKLKIAILDPVVTGEKLSEGVGIGVREIISGSFVNNAENYAIVERSMLNKVMEEANFSNSDAVDESQATRLGKLAGADKVILTVISKVDQRCLFSIKMINVETATIDHQISKMVDYSSLLDVAEPMTLVILGKRDANSISSSSSNSSNNTPVEEKEETKTPKATPQATPQNADPSAIDFPRFNGTGINYTDKIYDADPQPDEFNFYNFDRIFYATNFNIVFDFSETTVMGMSLPKFIEIKRRNPKKSQEFGNEFFVKMDSEMDRFTKTLNDETNVSFSFYPQAPITLVVKVRSIDEPGRENVTDYIFIDTETKKVITGMRLKTKGGRFGSWANLLGDALEEDAAPQIGKKFKSAKKKFKKL